MSLAIECCSGGPTTEKSKWLQDGLPCKSSGPPALPTIPPNFGGWVFVLNSLYCTPIRIFGMHFLIWDPNTSYNLLMSQPWPAMFVLPCHPQLILLCQAKSPVAFLLFGNIHMQDCHWILALMEHLKLTHCDTHWLIQSKTFSDEDLLSSSCWILSHGGDIHMAFVKSPCWSMTRTLDFFRLKGDAQWQSVTVHPQGMWSRGSLICQMSTSGRAVKSYTFVPS